MFEPLSFLSVCWPDVIGSIRQQAALISDKTEPPVGDSVLSNDRYYRWPV